MPLVKLHDRRELGEGQTPYATSNKRLTRSFSSDEAEANALPMGVLLKISFIVLVGCRSRETAFLWMSDFECLTTLSFSSALPVMP